MYMFDYFVMSFGTIGRKLITTLGNRLEIKMVLISKPLEDYLPIFKYLALFKI